MGLGPLHTRDWVPVTIITFRALSVVIKAELVKFASSHYARGTNGVCEGKMDVKSTWIPTWHQVDHVSWSLELFSKMSPRGGRHNIKLGDQGTLNAHNHSFSPFYHV